MKAVRYLLLIGAALACAGGARAATYYVSATGSSDSGPGSSASPWATLQHAVDSIWPGDTILVRSGVYAGCRIGQPGTAGAAKTLAADSGATVVVNTPGAGNKHGSIIEVENWDLGDGIVRYWVIDGLEVCNSPSHYGIDLRNTQYLTVRHCVVHDNGLTGLFDAFSDDNLYEFNESHHNHEHGFYHSNSGDRVTLRGNRSHHNDGCGIHMNGDASMGGDGVISGAVVERNVIWENGAVRGGSAINCDGVSDSLLRNNLLYDNHASGIALYVIDAAEGSSRNRLLNNTIVVPSDARWAINIPASDGGQPNPTGNVLLNNILLNEHAWHGAVTMWDRTALGSSDYNVVTDRFGYPDDSTLLDLGQWQALGFDAHSLVATPDQLFVNATGGDYHLATGSPACGAGTVLPDVTNDLEGTARPSGGPFDIGCYQTAAAPPSLAADFSVDVQSGVKPLVVNFTDLSTGAPTAWTWSFGDGGTSTAHTPSHTYTRGGHFTVSLVVSNGEGSDTQAKTDFVKVATFPDALPDSWAWAQIEACAADDVVRGFADGLYYPALPVTRDQMAVYVARALAGGDAAVPVPPATATFPDVPTDSWAFKYVEYAASKHVVVGYPDGYHPADAVDRAQMAVYISRSIASPTGDQGLSSYSPPATASFPDVAAGFWAFVYIEYAKGRGVVNGYPDGTYQPGVVVTRDQMAVYIANAFALN